MVQRVRERNVVIVTTLLVIRQEVFGAVDVEWDGLVEKGGDDQRRGKDHRSHRLSAHRCPSVSSGLFGPRPV